MGEGTTVRLRDDRLSWREIDDEIVALDLETSTYFTANATATVVIRRLASGADRDDLIGAVADEFDVDAGTAAEGVDTLLGELERMGLLEREGE